MGIKLGQQIIDKIRGKKEIVYIPESGSEKLISEIYWANVFRDTIQDSDWLKNKSFSPGRWAANYIDLYVLYRVLNDVKPKNILECGLGQSSKMTIQYAKHFNSKLNICEHNKSWIEFFTESYENVSQYIKSFDLENTTIKKKETLTYKDFKQKIGDEKFDLIFIDGPYGSKHYSRPQLLELDFTKNLEKSFVILFDDYQRKGEQETVHLVEENLKSANIDYTKSLYYSDKTLCIICSKDLGYLTSL